MYSWTMSSKVSARWLVSKFPVIVKLNIPLILIRDDMSHSNLQLYEMSTKVSRPLPDWDRVVLKTILKLHFSSTIVWSLFTRVVWERTWSWKPQQERICTKRGGGGSKGAIARAVHQTRSTVKVSVLVWFTSWITVLSLSLLSSWLEKIRYCCVSTIRSVLL